MELDKVTKKQKLVYDHSFTAFVKRDGLPENRLVIRFQGCTNDACFFPETRMFDPQADGTYAEALAGASDLKAASRRLRIGWGG